MKNRRITKEIGARLRLYRTEILGIRTQEEMGRHFNKSQAVYSTYENGTRSIGEQMYWVLGKSFGCNLNWLILNKGNPTVDRDIKSTTGFITAVREDIGHLTGPKDHHHPQAPSAYDGDGG